MERKLQWHLFLRSGRSLPRHLLRTSAPLALSSSSPSGRQAPALGSIAASWQVLPSGSFSTAFISSSNPKPTPISTEEGLVFASKSRLGIGRSVISKCSYMWEKKADALPQNCTLQDLLILYGDLSPETTRRFWRISVLTPDDFLEILLGLGTEDLSLRKVEFLWKLFRWAPKQSGDFCHLPRSYDAMVTVLCGAGMLEDAESLLLVAEEGRILAIRNMLFSEVVCAYAKAANPEKAMELFDKARKRDLIPSALCYISLLKLLINRVKFEYAVRVYTDMLEVGLGSYSEDQMLEFVVRQLTRDGKILDTVNLFKRLRSSGIKVSSKALCAVAEGLCKKKDFEDLLNFFVEWEYLPEVHICNKIISSLCRDLSIEDAWIIVQSMEELGFVPDATTFDILVCQSCMERKLRDGFLYLSECFSRSTTPNLHSYNAIINAAFQGGLENHVKIIVEDMVEKSLTPDLTTFKILLAGYCRFRKFDEVKQVLVDMRSCGLICHPLDDSLSEALVILGLKHLKVSIKRDNSVRMIRAEFFDSLGNGLYLDTDVEEYETSLSGILDHTIFPDFCSMLIKECELGDLRKALRIKDEAAQWGLNTSFSGYSKLLIGLCQSSPHIEEAVNLLDGIPELIDELDGTTLNLVIQMLSKNGKLANARFILGRLLERGLVVDIDTFSELITGFYRERDTDGLKECWEMALRNRWLPKHKDVRLLISYLCDWKCIREVLELFDTTKEYCPNIISDLCNILLKHLCITGYTNIACAFIEELILRNLSLDHTAYVNLFRGFLKEQKNVEALGIYCILFEKKLSHCANIFQLSLPLLIRFGMIEEAVDLKQSILPKEPKAVFSIYNDMITELYKSGRLDDAVSQLQEMLKNGMHPDYCALNIMMQTYCIQNNLGKTFETLCFMLRRGVNLSIPTYRILVKEMLVKGRVIGALGLKELIHTKTESLEVILCNILIFYLFQTRNGSLVKCFIKNIQNNPLFPDKNTYDFLVGGFHKCGNALESIEALDIILSKGMKPSDRSLRIVICHLISHGKFKKAFELSKMMWANGWRHGLVIQNAIITGNLLCGKTLDAEMFLDQIDKEGEVPSNANYDLLIKQFCLHGRIERAIYLLNLMLKKGTLPDDRSYSSVILGLCKLKAFNHALDFYTEMLQKNLFPTKESIYNLVCGLCTEGRTNEAREVLRKMFLLGQFPTYVMYKHVLESYYLSENLEMASELLHEMQTAGYCPEFETHWSVISNLSSLENRADDDKGILSGLLSESSFHRKPYRGKSTLPFK